MAEYGFDPTQDYAASYNALKARIANSYAGKRANLNQELATRGVQTSGVSSIPSARLGAAEAGEEASAASDFALEQARTTVADRQAALQFARTKELNQIGYDRQDALQRRMSQGGLQSALISGGIGALGSLAGGPVGGIVASKLASKAIPQPVQ